MKYICKFFLWILGWKAIDPPVEENKAVILGVPHTSAWDFVISYLYYTSVGGKAHVMIKKEFFWGPLSPILKSLGAVAVDRTKGSTIVKQIIDQMNKADKMHLAIAPEGTRNKTNNWKTGFHTIAKACNASVYLGYFDWKTKRVGRGIKFDLTDNVQEDLKKIRTHYKEMGLVGKYPDCFSTGDDLN